MQNSLFIRADEISEELGVSIAYAYKLVRQLNAELSKKGLVHHTRKQQDDDKFNMISGTNGLLGAADGAFLLQKEKRTDAAAILDISGRDQQDQRLYLSRDTERLVWQLERAETELWKAPSDPILEAVASLVTTDRTAWTGTPTELVAILNLDIKPNTLTMRLNINAGELLNNFGVRYENSRSHAGRTIKLTHVSQGA